MAFTRSNISSVIPTSAIVLISNACPRYAVTCKTLKFSILYKALKLRATGKESYDSKETEVRISQESDTLGKQSVLQNKGDLLRKVSAAKDAEEVLNIIEDKFEGIGGGIISGEDCAAIISAALARNNVDLAFSILQAMRCNLIQKTPERKLGESNLRDSSTQRWRWAQPDVTTYTTLVRGLAASLRVSDAIQTIKDIYHIGAPAGNEVPFGKVVKCPNCMIALAVVQPQNGIQVAETRFASNVIVLRRLMQVKEALTNMVTSNNWAIWRQSNTERATNIRKRILDEDWWERVEYLINLTAPIMIMLRYADMDRPCLGEIYDGIDSMLEKIKQIVNEKEQDPQETFFKQLKTIIIERWNKMTTPLHLLAYALTPKYYSTQYTDLPGRLPPYRDIEVSDGYKAAFQRLFPDDEMRDWVTDEFIQFVDAKNLSIDALRHRFRKDAHSWWYLHGQRFQRLQPLAIKVISQLISCSKCRYQYELMSGDIVSLQSESISTNISLMEKGMRFLQIIKRSLPAAVHSIMIRAPNGLARTHRFATDSADLPVQEGERATVALAAPSNVGRNMGPLRLSARTPGWRPGEPMSITNHVTGMEFWLLPAPPKSVSSASFEASFIIPALALLAGGDAATAFIDPTLPKLISTVAVSATVLGTAVNALVLPQLSKLPQRMVDVLALRQQLLSQYDLIQSRLKELIQDAEQEVWMLARMCHLENKIEVVGESSYSARRSRVKHAQESLDEALVAKLELIDSYAKIASLIEIEVEMDIDVFAAETATNAARIAEQIEQLMELEDLEKQWQIQAEANDEVERLLRSEPVLPDSL